MRRVRAQTLGSKSTENSHHVIGGLDYEAIARAEALIWKLDRELVSVGCPSSRLSSSRTQRTRGPVTYDRRLHPRIGGVRAWSGAPCF
jgi:hypothetical protein